MVVFCNGARILRIYKWRFLHFRKEPLEKVAKSNELVAYLHDGFWHCIDTKRDKDNWKKSLS